MGLLPSEWSHWPALWRSALYFHQSSNLKRRSEMIQVSLCLMSLCRQNPSRQAQCSVIFTFDHDHVDIYGTDVGLWQSFALLQQAWHFLRLHWGIRLRAKWHHLPHCHPCSRVETVHFNSSCQDVMGKFDFSAYTGSHHNSRHHFDECIFETRCSQVPSIL